MTELNFQELLLRELDRSAALRKRTDEDEAFRERRMRLRAWQAGRLARTHADLLVSPRFHGAAVFFLDRPLRPQRSEPPCRRRAPDRAA